MDHFFKLYDAWSYASISRTFPRSTRANAFGYKKGHSVDDMFSILFEAVSYAGKWADSGLVLFGMDVQTAFDSVYHDDVMTTYRKKGASAHQLLAMARNMSSMNVTLDIPGVAKTAPILHSKALKTGGKTDPDRFVRMFEDVIDTCLAEWEILGYGFATRKKGTRIPVASWVDNNFILANTWEEGEFMIQTNGPHL